MIKTLRYEKNTAPKGITKEAQEKLLNSKVLIMGAGGLGSNVIMNLAALGIGQIKIIDCGVIEESDFNRQIIHKYKNIGRAKVMSAKDWISDFNPDIKVELDKIKVNELNYFNTIQGYDIIVDCFDTYETKFMLNEIAIRHKKILIHGITRGFNGQVTTIYPPKTGCLSCIIQKPEVFKNTPIASISTVVSTISSLQAHEVFKIITGVGEPLFNKLLMFDGEKSEFKCINYSKSISCEDCSESEF